MRLNHSTAWLLNPFNIVYPSLVPLTESHQMKKVYSTWPSTKTWLNLERARTHAEEEPNKVYNRRVTLSVKIMLRLFSHNLEFPFPCVLQSYSPTVVTTESTVSLRRVWRRVLPARTCSCFSFHLPAMTFSWWVSMRFMLIPLCAFNW